MYQGELQSDCIHFRWHLAGLCPKGKKRVTVVAKSRGGHGDVRPEAQARLKDAPFPSCKSVFGHICAGHRTSQWRIHDMRHLIYIHGHVYITGNVPIELHTS